MSDQIIGINSRGFPSVQGGIVNIVSVLVQGIIGDYAVYMGFGPSEWVARHGDKLSFEEAQIHFPGIEKGKYRI